MLFKPRSGAWDWRDTSKLVIPVETPGGEPVTLLLRVSDGAERSLSGKASIAPGSADDLTLWIDAPSPRQMGMIGGPSLAAAGLEPHTLPVTATEGSVDAWRVTSVRLGIARPTAPRVMIVGSLRVMPPGETGKTAYQGIVDDFGQFRPGSWPEKVGSTEMLRAKGVEEAQQLAHALAQAPERERLRWGGIGPCLPCDRLFSHRTAGWQMAAGHPGRARLFFDRHRRGRAFRGDLCRGPRVHVPRSAGA
jgi:hypothetical protein